MKIVDCDVTITGLAVGVLLAWTSGNVVSGDDPEGEIAAMYCRSCVRYIGRREDTHDRT